MHRFISLLATSLFEKPKRYIFASLLVSFLMIPQLLTLESDFGVRIWFRTTDPLIKDLNELEQKFGNDERVLLAIHSRETIFSKKNLQILSDITEGMWMVPEIARVDSMANYNYSVSEEGDLYSVPFFENISELTKIEIEEKKSIALTDKIIKNRFISLDGKTAVVTAALIPNVKGSPNYRLIAEKVRELVKPYEKDSGLTFHPIGADAYNDAYREVSEDDLKVMIPVDFILMIVLLLFVFRSIDGFMFPVGLVCIVILFTMATGAFLGFKYDNLSAAIPGILIAICMADSIHILSTYYRSLDNTGDKKEALKATLHKNFIPTFLTSFSTMIGFFSLMTTELIPIKHLGALSGIGTGVAWVFTIFLICPMLKYVPLKKGLKVKRVGVSDELSARYTAWIDRNKKVIVYGISTLAIVSAYLSLQNKVNSDPLKHFSPRLKIAKDTNFLLDTFNGLGGPNVMIDSGVVDGIKSPDFMRKVEAFIVWLEEKDFVNKVTSITKTVRELNKKMNDDDEKYYVIPNTKEQVAELLLLYSLGLPQGMDLNNEMSIDNQFMRLVILWNVHDAQRSLKEIDKMTNKAKELGLEIKVTGKLPLYHNMVNYIVSSFFKSLSTALILISFLLFIVLKSWKLGALSLLPNVVPLIFGGAYMYLAGIYVDIGTSIVISVCLGIAVDDTIHFLSHYKEMIKSGLTPIKSLEKVFIHTGPALVFTTFILTICFGCFIFANFVPNINFGVLCSIILTIALVIDLVYLPAILLEFKVRK
jgi:uncharacterized protein